MSYPSLHSIIRNFQGDCHLGPGRPREGALSALRSYPEKHEVLDLDHPPPARIAYPGVGAVLVREHHSEGRNRKSM